MHGFQMTDYMETDRISVSTRGVERGAGGWVSSDWTVGQSVTHAASRDEAMAASSLITSATE